MDFKYDSSSKLLYIIHYIFALVANKAYHHF